MRVSLEFNSNIVDTGARCTMAAWLYGLTDDEIKIVEEQ